MRAPPRDSLLVDALDGAGQGVWDWDVETGKVFFSRGWASMLGYTQEELTGELWDWISRLHPDDGALAERQLRRHFDGETSSYVCEHRLRCKDGSYKWILAQGRVVERRGDGLPRRIIGTHTDVSERRQIEETLKQQEILLLEAQEVGRLGHWSFELATGGIFWSPQVYRIFCRDPALGPPSFVEYQALIHDDDWGLVQSHIEQSAHRDDVVEFRHRIRLAGGEVRHALCRCRRRCDAGGRPVSLLGTVADTSEAVMTMRALEQATEHAQRALRVKADFLATMSHEIRTPLNGILGLLELLTRTSLDEEQLAYATLASSSSKTLLALLRDVLEFSRAEAGKTELSRLPFSPRSVAEAAAQMIAPEAHKKGVRVLVDVADDVPERLLGDEARLAQIAMNLVTNAIKFTDSGEVRVLAGGEPLPDGRFELRLLVEDSGVGIPVGLASVLFEPYGGAVPGRRGSGVGLGLAICNRLATLMGGRLAVASEEGKGATFELFVPLPVSEPPLARPSLNRETCLLVVDPDPRCREATARILRAAGHDARGAGSVDEALACPQQVSLLVVDPGLLGAGSLALLRGRFAGARFVLMATFCHRGDAQEEGVGVVVKPICREPLLRAVARLLGGAPEDPPRSSAPRAAPGRVLVAEDDAINGKVISAMLKKLGYPFTLVGDGRQAVAEASSGAYEIVLMDCFMPEMDGYEATRQIRRVEGPGRLAIIAITANALDGDRERCLAAGMDDYLTKPIDFASLGQVLARHQRGAGA